jgi:hypothetical protein
MTLATMNMLGMKDVSSRTQKKRGTQVFELPIKNRWRDETFIRVASYRSGYVRRVDKNSYCWQLNKTREGTTIYRNGIYHGIERILIPSGEDRLRYLLNFCIKNYYIGHANLIHNGEYIPKWQAAQTDGKPCICRVTSDALKDNSNLIITTKDRVMNELKDKMDEFVEYVNMRNEEAHEISRCNRCECGDMDPALCGEACIQNTN